MSKTTPQVTIEKCPKCQRRHTFYLKIRRTLVMSLSGDERDEGPKTLTCLFTCPNTGQIFQNELRLKTPPAERIVSVEAGPLAEDGLP